MGIGNISYGNSPCNNGHEGRLVKFIRKCKKLFSGVLIKVAKVTKNQISELRKSTKSKTIKEFKVSEFSKNKDQIHEVLLESKKAGIPIDVATTKINNLIDSGKSLDEIKVVMDVLIKSYVELNAVKQLKLTEGILQLNKKGYNSEKAHEIMLNLMQQASGDFTKLAGLVNKIAVNPQYESDFKWALETLLGKGYTENDAKQKITSTQQNWVNQPNKFIEFIEQIPDLKADAKESVESLEKTELESANWRVLTEWAEKHLIEKEYTKAEAKQIINNLTKEKGNNYQLFFEAIQKTFAKINTASSEKEKELTAEELQEARKQSLDVLSLAASATDKEIKKAYHKLALQYHPDKNSSHEAVKKMAKINKAYNFLTDASKKGLPGN